MSQNHLGTHQGNCQRDGRRSHLHLCLGIVWGHRGMHQNCCQHHLCQCLPTPQHCLEMGPLHRLSRLHRYRDTLPQIHTLNSHLIEGISPCNPRIHRCHHHNLQWNPSTHLSQCRLLELVSILSCHVGIHHFHPTSHHHRHQGPHLNPCNHPHHDPLRSEIQNRMGRDCIDLRHREHNLHHHHRPMNPVKNPGQNRLTFWQ